MAQIIVNKYHLIAMCLWTKHLNNEPTRLTERELINYANAFASDPRRPKTDYMDNIYKYDFSQPIVFGESDVVGYERATNTYYLKTKNTVEVLQQYMVNKQNKSFLPGPMFNFLELLGKEKRYRSPNNQPNM